MPDVITECVIPSSSQAGRGNNKGDFIDEMQGISRPGGKEVFDSEVVNTECESFFASVVVPESPGGGV